MTGTFKTKTRVYTSPQFVTPIVGRKSFVDAAVDFRRSLIENSSMAVLDADIAVKAAMGAGLSSSQSVGQTAQGTSPDSDGKKRVNKGGVPGMVEDEMGYRYMPEATWGPGKVLKMFPSKEERQSSNKVPNFGFVDKEPMFTPEQYVQMMEQKPKIRMSKYKINTRTGEPIEDTEVEFDRMRFGKTFKLNPDVSDEIDENISDEIQEKSLGSSLKERMPGASIAGRAAARFGVIMDELGKMRCPPGTPAANQFTDMTGSNCFGITPGNIISEAINLAQRLVPDDDPRRSSGFTRGIANFLFDMENGIFGNNVWYHADGTRMKHGEWRKFREAGGVAKNERWMVNGVERVYAELDAQDARMADLYAKLGLDLSDAKTATNEHLYEAFKKLKESGVITADLLGKPTPAQVEAMMTARLKNADAHWIARTDEEKRILLSIEIQRYRELEKAHLEAFLDEVIKNPDHMKTIGAVRFVPNGKDRASFGIEGIDRDTNLPISSINIDIPNSMAFQDSMLPNLSPDERLRIWAESGQSDAVKASAVKDFLVNSNAYAGQMMAMVDGGRGLGRHDMKHEIAHSIQAVAIFEHMKSELDARGSFLIPGKNGSVKTITSVDQLTSGMLLDLMVKENHMGIDLDSLSSLRSRADVVAFLSGKYIDDVTSMHGDNRRASEIGAELWALRSAGLIYGDDVDAALEYMDNVASGKITADRDVADNILTRRIYEEHLDGSRRIREAREASERATEYREAAEAEAARLAEEADLADSSDAGFFDADERAAEARMSAAREAYAQEKRAEVKATKEAAKTMTEDEMVDFLSSSTEASDALTEILDASDDAGEEFDWMSVMDRDTLDAQTKAVVDEWVKRFTVRRSPEALDKLQKMIDDKRESRGTLSPQKIEERRHREFLEGATERAKDMDLGELVQHYSDWEELAAGEGLDGPERIRRKAVRDMYRDEYLKRRTEGPDSISKEDARKEFNSKFKEIRKPKTVAEKEKQKLAKPKKFTSHNGKNGARTFATEERARLLEGATTAEKIAFVEMGSGDTDVINMMGGSSEGLSSARAIQRRNTRLRKNGLLPDGLNQHEASIEEQVENFYIPLLELMDKSSLSQTVEMHVDRNEDTEGYIADILNGGPADFTNGINSGTLVTSSTDFSDGKKIIVRFPEGSKALFPDWSYSSDSDNGEQKIIFPPSKLHLVEVRDDGTVVLEVGEQMGTEAALKGAVREIGAGPRDTDVAYRQGLQKKVSKVVDKRIVQRRRQGMFDPEKSSPIEEERFNTTADTAATGAGFMPDRPPSTPRRFATNDDDIGTGDFDDDLSPDERRWRMEEMRSRGNDRLSSGAKWGQMPSSNEQLARLLEPSNNDGFNEIYGPPQTREERITQMAEMQSEVMTSLREMFDNVPGAGDSLGLDITHIDPVLADFIKNSSDEEIYNLVSESAKNLHESFDSRPRVRMRQDELDRFAASGRYGREESFNTDRLSSGKVKKGIRARAKERAIEMIADRIGKDEDSKEIAEMFLDTVSALKFGPEAALTRLAIDLGRRGSRDVAERTVQELIDRGKITDDQAKSILSKLDKIAPDGLPEPLKRGVGRAARATAEALDTPENRDRLDSAREAVGEAAGRAREAVGEGARNVVERSRERLKKLRERDDAGSLPSSPEDVPFGDFDPADAPVDPFSSGRRLDRRVANSDAGREQIMEGASRTRTRLSSGEAPKTKEPKKPFKPREPDNGPMTGKFIDIFRGVSSYQEMLDRYNEQEVIFFDYETTGLEPNLEKPVQIGAVKMKGGKVVERFNIFVNPGKELSDWSKENLIDADGNPLTDEWLSKQVSIADAHQQLIDFFGPDALLGGQYTPFDLGFLEQSLKDSGLEWKPAGVMDSKALADELLPRWTPDGGDGPFMVTDNGTKKASNSLGPLSDYLGVNLTAWHTADADSEASAMIVQKILERAAERNDTPKHLLDVDNLPNIVTERRAKHKLEMDKYDAEMKQYKVDLEEYKSSQTADKQTGGERFSSGETYKKLVREQGRPSEKQREAISDVKDLLKDDEFNIADEWDDEDGTIDSPKRAELKEKITKRITEAFSHDIEAREDVVVIGKNGEEINLGKDFEAVVTEVSVDVQNYDPEALDIIKEEEMYDVVTGSQSASPSTMIRMKIAIKPKDKEAAKRLEEAGIPDLLLPDYYDGKTPADDIQIGNSARSIAINGDDMNAVHESLFIRDEAKGKGIGSLFNAKNEGVYEELGVKRIFTQGQSSELGESEGGTHWPRNGFTWAGEKSKQDFIKVIDDALRKRKGKFSEEERARISSLYRKNPSTGKFETDASPEELVDFEHADQLFQEQDVAFMFKRDIELASAGGARFSSGESRNTDSSGLIDKEILDKYLQEFSRSDDWMSDTFIPVDGRGRYPIPGVLPKKPDYLPLWDSILPRIEADRKKREAEEAARLVSYAQLLRPHNMGHRIDKPFNEMSDTELKLHMKYIEGSQPQGYPALGLDGWRAEKEAVEKELRRRRISPNFTHAQKEEADQIVKDFNYERAEKEARRVAEAIKQSEEMRARLPQPGTPEHARVEELNKQLIELEDRRIKRMNVLRNLENPTDAEKAEYEAISQLDHPYMTAKTPRLVDGYEEWEKFATAREKQKRDVLDGKMGWNEAAKMLEERNQGYADALFPKTKESEFKVGKVKPEKPTRISSGEVKRDLKPGALKADTSELIASDDGYKKKKFTVHQIGDEKIVFGAKIDHGGDFEGIKRVAINPYEISGHDNMSTEGREFAMKWTAAHAAQIAEDEGKSSTKVDALLYAAARGDSEAMKEFELLAAKGERLIEEERKLQSKESLGWQRPWQGNSEWKLNEAYDEASKAAIKKEGLEDLSMKDLYLVHETKYDLVEDADGNLILRPLGDHELKDRDGNPAEYHRDTLHFALNHLAGGHFMRQEQQGNIIVVPLSSVLEQNPDSLDALFAVDTYLVPKPGEPLVLPKGAFKTIPKGSSNPKEETEKALKEMGASHLFEAGDTHSSQGVDGKIRQMASEMGIQSTIHANIPHAWMEQKVSAQEPEYALTARELAQMSPNARMRLADNDRFSSVKTEVDNTRMFSGEVIKPKSGATKPDTEGEGPRSKKPKRVKKYKGYTLNEPDNPTTKPGEYPDDVVEAATKHRAEIEKVEVEITKLLIDLAEKNKANMEGLDFRLKSLKSLIRKIAAEKDSEHGGDADKAAKAMSDVVRYTMSYEPEDYIAGVKDVIAEMQKLGYDLRVKNYWKGDDPYQGINVAVTHPNGTQFELQFHTPQSVADKEKIHLIYDNYRTETDPKKRWIMYNRMVRIANKIGVPVPPDELLKIGIVKEQPFTPR